MRRVIAGAKQRSAEIHSDTIKERRLSAPHRIALAVTQRNMQS